MFVVDAADPARLPEAQRELLGLLRAGVPVAVFGNKVDAPGSLAAAQLQAALALPAGGGASGSGGPSGGSGGGPASATPTALFLGSVWHETGYPAAFAWLSQQL